MTVGDDVEAEREMLADSLQSLGPHAQAGCGDWTAFDLAAHIVAGERAAGLPAFCIRMLAAQGVQFHPKPQLVNRTIMRERQADYSAVIGRLRRRCPRLLLAPPVAASTLFEVWMHHDDLTTSNGLAHGTPHHLAEAIPPLVRYQANRLPAARLIIRTTDDHEWGFGPDSGHDAVLIGPTADLVRWLAGRRPFTALDFEAEPEIADQLRGFVGKI